MPVIFITKDDEVSKKKTLDFLKLTGESFEMVKGERNNDKQMILVGEDNALKTFLDERAQNPHGMQNGRHHDGDEMHWYVPP